MAQIFFSFSPIPGDMSQFDLHIFFRWVGKHHQLAMIFVYFLVGSSTKKPPRLPIPTSLHDLLLLPLGVSSLYVFFVDKQ